jgi:hypothetical protein
MTKFVKKKKKKKDRLQVHIKCVVYYFHLAYYIVVYLHCMGNPNYSEANNGMNLNH